MSLSLCLGILLLPIHWFSPVKSWPSGGLQEESPSILKNMEKEFHCGHIPPKLDQIRFARLESNQDENGHSIQKRESLQKLRVKYFYDDSVQKISKEKFFLINDLVLPQAIQYWQRALFVKNPVQGPIKLSRKCMRETYDISHNYCIDDCDEPTFCGEVVIPPEHLDDCYSCNEDMTSCSRTRNSGSGIPDADFVFYISSFQSERCKQNNTIAYAAHCQQEINFFRPIAGHANICPDSISTKPQDLETLISVFKHEILHALGFSVSLYAFYADPNGKQPAINLPDSHPFGGYQKMALFGVGMTISKKVLQRIERKWKVHGNDSFTHPVFVISTPNVVREVREHFNCSTLEGAELENQGEEGTILAHWEKRLFENEAMTGSHTQNPVFSRITLALMEDTGWYRVNYSLAQPLEWGRGLGCDFAMKSCKEWMDLKQSQGLSIHPFCDRIKKEPVQTECTNNRDSIALCNLLKYDYPLDAIYQNFDHLKNVSDEDLAYYGGSVALADYCPYIQQFNWKLNNKTVRGSKCAFSENNPIPEKNFAFEQYGAHSKCMNHGEGMWVERNCYEIRQWQYWGSGCYQYRCEDGFLNLIILNYTYKCLYRDQEIKIQLLHNDYLHKGSIICPDCNELCENCKIVDESDLILLKSQTKYVIDHLKCSAYSPNYIDSFLISVMIGSLIFSYKFFC